eukprot:scpid32519/ scgid29117/ 
MQAVEESPLIKAGTLSKRGSGWLKRWTKRYWELRSDGYLSYFINSRKMTVRRGLVDVKHNLRSVLMGREAIDYGGGNWPKQSDGTFLILVTEERVYCLMAEDGYECHDWVQGLAMFAKMKPDALNGVSADTKDSNGFLANGLKNNKQAGGGAGTYQPTERYDALASNGEDGWEDDPGPGQFDIVYDSPIRDTTLRPSATMAINVSSGPSTAAGKKGTQQQRRQPVAVIKENGDSSGDGGGGGGSAEVYEEYEVDSKKEKKGRKTKLPRLPSRFSRKRQNSLQRSKRGKHMPALPKKPGRPGVAAAPLNTSADHNLPEPIPRKSRAPPKTARGSGPTPPPPPQKYTLPGTFKGKSNQPVKTADPTPAPRRRGSPPNSKFKQPPRKSSSSKLYVNNAQQQRSSAGPPPPPARHRHGSFSEGSGSSGEVVLSQPKLIGRKPGDGRAKAMVPAKGRR